MEQRQGTVLCVDDDDANRLALTNLFRAAGFEVQEAATGSEALRLVATQPDLVILDVSLPDINGVEVCRQIKGHPATTPIPVMHLSGVHVTPEDRTHALEEGADAYLTKPVEPRELIAQARALLRNYRAEERARQSQKMEALGQLADGVAHDFTNLLAAITRDVSALLAGAPEQGPQRELLQAIDEAAWRAVELTGHLVEFSRQTAPRLRPTRLQSCLDEVAGRLRRSVDARITLEVRGPADGWPILANPAQIEQVLTNLCLNARDAMPEGGHLLLEAANVVLDEGPAGSMAQTRAGEFVRLRVRDSGPGIPPEVRSHVFEPFFTTRGSGKGLGLAVVFGIVRQHQGWVECASAAGGGTCVDVYLPRWSEEVASPAPRDISEALLPTGPPMVAPAAPPLEAGPDEGEESAPGPVAFSRSGLTKAEAEQVLDWLEAHGCQAPELHHEEGQGFAVRMREADEGSAELRCRRSHRLPCPGCGSTRRPFVKREMGTLSWVLVGCGVVVWPLLVVGLLLRREVWRCWDCRRVLGRGGETRGRPNAAP